jgi:predicted N-acetyltransferase YhbS
MLEAEASAAPDLSGAPVEVSMNRQAQLERGATREVDASPEPIAVRPIRPEDAEACGRVGFEAHGAVAAAHNVPSEQPSLDFAIGMMQRKLADRDARGFVAEREGRIVGSLFLNTFPPAPVAVIGPLTVHPEAQGGTGRRLMDAALEEARRRGFEAVRLVQSPAHLRSLVLYLKVGFEVREPLVLVQGDLPPAEAGTAKARPATEADIAACNALCRRVHGLEREHELRGAIARGGAMVAERAGELVGYSAGLGFLGHAVAETTGDLKALIAGSPGIMGPGFFVPTRNGELLRWLLEAGMRAAWPATLMSLGPYQDPAGAFLPSIAF